MQRRSLFYLPALLGMLCGIASNYSFLAGSWSNLIFWGFVGVLLGFFAGNKREAARIGMTYGAFLTLSFLFSGFKGTSEKLLAFSLLAIILSVLGALCGLIAASLGNWIKRRMV